MGPPQADVALREALAMGCDDALLISDRAFGGADTWATSSTIAAALKKLDYDAVSYTHLDVYKRQCQGEVKDED